VLAAEIAAIATLRFAHNRPGLASVVERQMNAWIASTYGGRWRQEGGA
jgi:hypothetical protein